MKLKSFFSNYGSTFLRAGIFNVSELNQVESILRPLSHVSLNKMFTHHLEEIFVPGSTSLKKERSLVKRLFKNLHARGFAHQNIAACLKQKRYATRKSTFTVGDVNKSIDFFYTKNRSPYAREMARYILYAAATGQRRAELLGLRVKDISLEEGLLIIEKSKNMQDRRIIEFKYFIEPFKTRLLCDIEELVESKKANDLVFGFPCAASPSRIWNRSRKRIGIREDLHLHDIRRLVLRKTLEQQQRPSVGALQNILGHKSARTSCQYYLEVTGETLNRMESELST